MSGDYDSLDVIINRFFFSHFLLLATKMGTRDGLFDKILLEYVINDIISGGDRTIIIDNSAKYINAHHT